MRQIEEIEVLTSIYMDSFELENENSYSVVIEENGVEVRLCILLNPDYPSNSPPTYTLSAPHITREQRRDMCAELDRVFLDNLGECIVHLWVEEVRTYLQDGINPPTTSTTTGDSQQMGTTDAAISDKLCDTLSSLPISMIECPVIETGTVFEDRKSVFQGHAAVVTSVEQVQAVKNKLYENKKIAHASHNMYAYRIYSDQRKTWIQDCEDDGETAAGGRILHLLEIVDAKNVLVVVSRWYGGILLGPDRFKHINNAARQVLEQAGLLVQDKNTKKKKKK